MRSLIGTVAALFLVGCTEPRSPGVTVDADGWSSTSGGPKPMNWKPWQPPSQEEQTISALEFHILQAETHVMHYDARFQTARDRDDAALNLEMRERSKLDLERLREQLKQYRAALVPKPAAAPHGTLLTTKPSDRSI
ncbi:MAG: hypothetical protein K8U03_06885 [Planctomycetia bacterium]|nr:hypothetical protein [Planctomycetia bacterium]